MSKFTAAELVEFYQEVADGAEMLLDGEPRLWAYAYDDGPNLLSDTKRWRIKPAKKIIDMAHFIKSGIDMEFSDSEVFLQIGKLTGIQNGEFCKDNYQGFNYCRPRMNHKMFHDGGERPLPEGFVVEVYYRSGGALSGNVTDFHWLYSKTSSCVADIIGYKILRKADGYSYE